MTVEFEQLKDRPVNYVNVVISVENGCDPKDGEYSLYITGFLGSLDIGVIGGVDDVSLIKECIENEDLKYPKEGEIHLVLKESGEWEDVFWHKYYVVERVCVIEY